MPYARTHARIRTACLSTHARGARSSADTGYSMMHHIARELSRELRLEKRAEAGAARRRAAAEARAAVGGEAAGEEGEEDEEEDDDDDEDDDEDDDDEPGSAKGDGEEGGAEEGEEGAAKRRGGGGGGGGSGGELCEGVLRLREEVCGLGEAAVSAETFGSVEVQIGQLRSELYQVHAEPILPYPDPDPNPCPDFDPVPCTRCTPSWRCCPPRRSGRASSTARRASCRSTSRGCCWCLRPTRCF